MEKEQRGIAIEEVLSRRGHWSVTDSSFIFSHCGCCSMNRLLRPDTGITIVEANYRSRL